MNDVRKFIIEYLFNFRKFFSVSLAGLICLVLVIVMVISSSFLYTSYTRAKDTEAKIAEIHSFLYDWQNKVDKLNSAELRPVSIKNLDDIQATLLFTLQNNHLKLNSFRALTPIKHKKAKPNNPDNESVDNSSEVQDDSSKDNLQNSKYDFEIVFEGEYEPVMQYINGFKSKNALINIQSVELKSNKGIITAHLRYRAYTI